MDCLHRPLTDISIPEVASGLCGHIYLPTGWKGTTPHLKHCEVCSSDAVSAHSPVLSIYKQEWRNRGQGGVWYEGGRLVLQPAILNHIVILPGYTGSASGQFSLECRVPQCLLSAALVWTLAKILRHQTNSRHHIVAVVVLNNIFIIIAEPYCTWLFLVTELDKTEEWDQTIWN